MHRFKTLCTAVAVASCIALVACEGAESRKEKYIGVGIEMLEKGDLEKARISFKNVLKIDPKDIKANFYYAQTLEKLEDWPAAAGQYNHVLELDPANTEAAISMGKILLLAKAADQVLEQAAKILQREPDNADARVLKAAALLLKGNAQDAGGLIDQVVSSNPDNADAAILKSSMAFEKRDYVTAEKVLEAAVHKNPDNISVLMLLSKVYAVQSKPEQTERTLRSIVEKDPRPQHYSRLSEFLFKEKRVADSETVLAQGIERFPDSEPLKRTLVGVIEQQGDLARAEKRIREFIDSSDEPEVVNVYLAEKMFSWQREEEAVALLKTISDQQASDKAALSAMNLLALYRQSNGDLDEAMSLVNRVLEKNANDPQALNFRARVAIEKTEYDAAITDLRTALNQDKQNPQLMKPLVVAYLKKGEIDLAVDQVRTLLTLDPLSVEARALAAQVFEKKGDLAAVEEHLVAALRSQPDNESLLQALAGNAVQRKDWEDVKAYAQRWSRIKPENSQPFYLRGLAEESLGHPPQALEMFSNALALSPDAVEPATAIVRMYLSNGQSAEALQWIDAALKARRNAHLLNLKGEALLSAKDTKGAQSALEESIALQPDWWVPYRSIAMIQIEKNDLAAASLWFEKGIAKAHNSNFLRAEYAALLEKNGKPDAAIQQYRTIVTAAGSVPEAAINNLAMLLVTYSTDAQKLSEARELVSRLEKTQNPWYLDTVGWVYLKSGQTDKALQFIRRASELIADQPIIRYHLGVAYFSQNDRLRAESALQASLDAGKKFPGIKDAEDLLKKIKSEKQQG